MTTRRSSIATNPFDVIVSTPVGDRPHPAGATPPSDRRRFTVFLSLELQERARNAAFWSPGLSLAGLTERAFSLALEEIERSNGGPYPRRLTDLRGGHPVS